MAHTGITGGLEVTGEVCESTASIVSGPAENRPHHLAIFVAALGRHLSNARGHA
jgi:ornithine carbamoyltransferase